MDKPRLDKLLSAAPGAESRAVVLIRGYLSERSVGLDKNAKWCDAIRRAGFDGAIYLLWWDSSRKRAVGKNALAGWHWRKVQRRAKRVGRRYFADLLRAIPADEVVIVAHSAGTRVAYYGLTGLKRVAARRLSGVVLTGGAIGRDRDWATVARGVSGPILNLYCPKDAVLRVGYGAGCLWKKKPIGRAPIPCAAIVNIDISGYAPTRGTLEKHKNHWAHVNAFHRVPAVEALFKPSGIGRTP